jgi:hypothetical protein
MVLVYAHLLFTTKTYNHEKFTLHRCCYSGNWLGIRIFCISHRGKYNTRTISYSNHRIAFGGYKTSLVFRDKN